MHELPIAEGILRVAVAHAAKAGAGRITDIHVVLGELAGFSEESIEFYWDILTEGTSAHGSRLRFRRTPFLLQCDECGARFEPNGDFGCPTCACRQTRIAGGDELRVEFIDVEESGEVPVACGGRSGTGKGSDQ